MGGEEAEAEEGAAAMVMRGGWNGRLWLLGLGWNDEVWALAMAMALTQTTWLLLAAAALRLLFIAFGEWQDAHMEVRYTDIDYQVFSDAAALLAKGRSPFERETYRYSPLLALFLVPNVLLHPAWGKIFFSAAGMSKQFLFS